MPEVSFNGGNPTYSGSGISILSGYTKAFFNTWQISSGLDSTEMSAYPTGVRSYISLTTLPYSSNYLYLTVRNRNWWDSDLSYAQLIVSGLDNTIETAIITGGYVV